MRFNNKDRYDLANLVISVLNPVQNINLKIEDMKYWKVKIGDIINDYTEEDYLANLLARNNLDGIDEYERRSIFDTIYKDKNRFKKITEYTERGKTVYKYKFIQTYSSSSSSEPEELQFKLEIDDTDFPTL